MLEREEVFQKLKEILLIMDPSKKDLIDKVSEDTYLVNDLGLSSVAMLYMVVAIEETFQITFDDLGVEDFKTVRQTVDYILEKIKA